MKLNDNIEIFHGDCLDIMTNMNDESIDLVVTSPPYFNLREYSFWETYDTYLADLNRWFKQLGRIIKTGRHVCWNIQSHLPSKIGNNRYHFPLSADTVKIAYSHEFMLERTVVWHKTNSVCQRMFGSYPYPPNILYTPNTEDIHVFRKIGKTDLSNKSEKSKITKEEWNEWTLSIWKMPIGYNKQHTAMFPLELPTRCIRLHSFINDIILDPFSGLSTTGMACINTGRKFVGIEKEKKYFDIAKERLENFK